MKNWKWMLCVAVIVAMCVSLSACMMNNDAGDVEPQQTPQVNFMPQTTAQTGVAGIQEATQPPAAFDWVTGAGQIEANLNRISEISDSRVVVNGTTALVAVKFTSAYQGEMTERIRGMIAAEVMKADPNIQTVAVTAEEADVGAVYDLAERVRSGEPLETLGDKIMEIVRNVTTLR